MSNPYSLTKPNPIATSTNGKPVDDTKDVDSPTLKKKGIFFISGGFTSNLANQVVTWILEANLDQNRDYDHLTLIINSHGGEVDSCFAIIDTMRGSALPVHTIGLGAIQSCGLNTFMAGAKGHRILTPNTSILSHQFAWGSHGKEHELLATVREFNNTSEKLIRHYVQCTGLTEAEVKEKLMPSSDVWLKPEEAIALGIADEIRIISA